MGFLFPSSSEMLIIYFRPSDILSYLHFMSVEQANPSVTLLRSIWFPCSLTCISYLLKARKFSPFDLIILPAILSAVFLQQKKLKASWSHTLLTSALQRFTGVGRVQVSTAGNRQLQEEFGAVLNNLSCEKQLFKKNQQTKLFFNQKATR